MMYPPDQLRQFDTYHNTIQGLIMTLYRLDIFGFEAGLKLQLMHDQLFGYWYYKPKRRIKR